MNPLDGPRVVCPYCYSDFTERQIRFRCVGRPGPSGDTCSLVVDPAMRTHWGRADRMPPVFEANGRRAKAVCPSCSVVSDRKVCMVCHARMPVNFGRMRGRMIAMVGARNSGKTVFMTVLIHELKNRVGSRFNASVGGSDDHTRQSFGRDYESKLYEDGGLLPATSPAAGGNRAPLLFRFTTKRRGLTGNRPDHTLLSFFDTAGEDLHDAGSVETNLRYLNNADGVIVLLDTLQMDGARRMAPSGTLMPARDGAENQPIHMLERVTDLLMRREGSPKRLIQVPIAVCLTKTDALRGAMDEGSPLHRPQPSEPFFDETDSQDVHAQIQQLLDRWGSAAIDDHVRNHYRNARYFGVSSLGDTPSENNRIQGGVRPYRVADPFLWLLSEFGVIPSRSRQR
ncbi:TRAFAC clade GTPase domain-containing protein [Nocardiopsis nanhaiensis]